MHPASNFATILRMRRMIPLLLLIAAVASAEDSPLVALAKRTNRKASRTPVITNEMVARSNGRLSMPAGETINPANSLPPLAPAAAAATTKPANAASNTGTVEPQSPIRFLSPQSTARNIDPSSGAVRITPQITAQTVQPESTAQTVQPQISTPPQ